MDEKKFKISSQWNTFRLEILKIFLAKLFKEQTKRAREVLTKKARRYVVKKCGDKFRELLM